MEVDGISHALLAELLSGWEIVLILAIVLIIFGAKSLPHLGEGLRRGIDEFKKATGEVVDEVDEAMKEEIQSQEQHRVIWPGLRLWIAQGFGIGRIPFAPGTFGSLVGLLWFALLLETGNFWFYVGGTLSGVCASVRFCGTAEKILKQTDPDSVVFDEIAALPLCFLAWVAAEWFRANQLPSLESFFGPRTWVQTAIVFVLFRLFDILKPWPVRQSQRLPGGWGVTIDDVLAATYVALVSLPFVL